MSILFIVVSYIASSWDRTTRTESLARPSSVGAVRTALSSAAAMPALYVLFESASGYALMEAVEAGDLAAFRAAAQASINDLARFSKMVKLKGFQVRAYAAAQFSLWWQLRDFLARPNNEVVAGHPLPPHPRASPLPSRSRPRRTRSRTSTTCRRAS